MMMLIKKNVDGEDNQIGSGINSFWQCLTSVFQTGQILVLKKEYGSIQ